MLDLSYNNISDEGVHVFSKGCLATNKLMKLSILRLNGNGFGADGTRYLAESLKSQLLSQIALHPHLGQGPAPGTFSGLQRLELSGNRIGDEGLEAIAGYLRHNPCLKELFLDSCLLGDDGMQSAHDFLLTNKVRATDHFSVGYVRY